jgi:hypothetical protein
VKAWKYAKRLTQKDKRMLNYNQGTSFLFPRPRKATATYMNMHTRVADALMSKAKIGFFGFKKASEMCFRSHYLIN